MICPICEQDCGGTCEDAQRDMDREGERRMLDREYQQSLRQETQPSDWDDRDYDAHPDEGPDEDEAFAMAEDE